jgi:CheY-like chemotaxis protein
VRSALDGATALSSIASAKDRQDAFALGFQEHAAKPLVPDDLIALVARCTRKPL